MIVRAVRRFLGGGGGQNAGEPGREGDVVSRALPEVKFFKSMFSEIKIVLIL